ncbi:MAG: hypothetical protein ACE5GX_09535, partial [Thermoanaerobaculia bacterium]
LSSPILDSLSDADGGSPSETFQGTLERPDGGAAEVPRPGMDSAAIPLSGTGVGWVRRGRTRLTFPRLLELLVLSVVIGGCMVLAFNQYWVRPRIEKLETRLADLTGDSRGGGAPGSRWVGNGPGSAEPGAQASEEKTQDPAASQAQRTAAVAVPAAQPGPPDPTTVAESVQAWARAWSERSVDDYLDSYSDRFVPASGLELDRWRARRRERLLNQGAIRVAVVSLSVEELAPNEQRVAFTQSYRSEVYHDRVRKSLRMVWEDGRWKIVEEVVVRQLPW